MKWFYRWAWLLGLIWLAGCQPGGLALSNPLSPLASPEPTQTQAAAATAAVSPAASPSATPNRPLTIWLPARFSPYTGKSGADLLKDRLAAYQAAHPQQQIEVRIKAETGPGGLLDSLSAASAAAPDSLPDLIVLPRTDLETAALKGLIYPLDTLSTASKDPDWYPYARQLMLVQGSTFGLPLAGDALALIYRPGQIPNVPTDWAGMGKLSVPVGFPAADPQALLTLAFYQAAGGKIQDSQQRPILQANALASVLSFYSDGLNHGTFPAGNALSDSYDQVWQAYHDHKTNLVITWISHYLAELPPDSSVMTLPAPQKTPQTIATGWLLAVASPSVERRSSAAQLAEFLAQSDFLSRWTAAAGFLPPRPSALSAWPDHSLATLISQIELTAASQPGIDLNGSLGPLLRDAAVQVIKGQGDPQQIAQNTVQGLQAP